MQNIHSESIVRLYRAILTLRTEEECAAFFEDVCTVAELQDMSKRLDVAFLLHQGLNYQEVTKRVGISSATITRVSKCVNYGNGGYGTVIARLNGTEGGA